ncbi:alpha/beta fold hydrolase [Actinophytocola sp.]|uniref:alpha/beta fold hydrolase n=1 Tax=Actinophytocola sp. TaxID=1872138 RepID=UPI002D7FFAC6|nr:alpha/beta fold hydrolase [Actinophytocola sp.]HET9143942.1 alpha/beta fold hydrolase [Actinophytocola sp.]
MSGNSEPLLVLLHGLGANSKVWDGLADLLPGRWPGEWLAHDLPGHGFSGPLHRYSFGALAAEVAEDLPPGRPLVVLGHSLGGAVGLALGSGWFGVAVTAVCGLGIKVRWTGEELVRATELAARPNRVFATRAEAADRALRVAGLTGLVPPDAPLVDDAIREVDGGWRLALDPAAFAVGAPDMAGLLAACRAKVILAAGADDPMSPEDHLRELRPDPVVLPGLGHNAHVEDPAALLPILDRLHD